MKNNKKATKKLTDINRDSMWGDEGPYSQVNIKEQIRILDDRVSRVFLVVEVEINPFTFEYVKKNREQFANDRAVQELIDHAEYRGEFGYVTGAGEVESKEEGAREFVRVQADMTVHTLIRMHKFIIDEFGLKKVNKYGVVKDKWPLVWNEEKGSVEIDSGLWDVETLVGSPAGIIDNKARCFIVLAFTKDVELTKKTAKYFAETLENTSNKYKVEVEDCESFMEYILITALLPLDVAPASFIESAIDACNSGKKPIFQKDYFVTNVKRPTPDQIISFLKQLPLDKDIRMDK